MRRSIQVRVTRGAPAAELVPAPPADVEAATAMMAEAVADFQRAALRQAVLVSHARSQIFRGDAGPWLSWCVDTCGLSRRYAIMLWHAGDMLRRVQHAALLGCSAEKLELLSQLSDAKLQMFLERNDPVAMSREDVRAKVRTYLQPATEDGEAVDGGGDGDARKSRGDASPVARHFKAIDLLSCVPDEDRLLIAAKANPTACIQAGLACLDIACHLLGTEMCWDQEQLERWAPEIRSAVSVYEAILRRATPGNGRG